MTTDANKISTNYLTELPSEADIRERLIWVIGYWKGRNEFIKKTREALGGQNKIEAPRATQYKVRTLHSYLLTAVTNEKSARFLSQPSIQIVPGSFTPASRQQSSELERAINIIMSEMELNGEGDVWARMIMDAITIDEGVERIERAPAAFWPEFYMRNEDGSFTNAKFEDPEQVKIYKADRGVPVRSVYVPLENYYPIYEGANVVESFETERRALRSVLRNRLFSEEGKARVAESAQGVVNNPGVEISIIHYTNHRRHAYYAILPASGYTTDRQFAADIDNEPSRAVGDAILLHSYSHGLGRTIYNSVPGRFGGWKTEHNRIEGVGQGLLELSQSADELISQVLTNARARYWPTLAFKVNPELRAPDGGTPKAPQVNEGENLVMYKDEELGPIFDIKNDESVPWLWERISEQIARLGGSPVLFGSREAGVDTGYHQALQITQAEHLDEKLEQHLASGGIQRARLILQHVIAMGQDVVVKNKRKDSKGNFIYDLVSISPRDLEPFPQVDASVRKPRPVDFAASLRAAREASDDRGGKGPLLDDDTILSQILNQDAPDDIKRRILIQQEQNKILQTGILTEKITAALNLKLAIQDVPNVNDETASNVDPALANVISGRQNAAIPDASTMPTGLPNGAAGGGGVNLPTGPTPRMSQPEANAGLEIANSMRMSNGR